MAMIDAKFLGLKENPRDCFAKRFLAALLLLCLIISGITYSSTASAQSDATAKQLYQSGNFKGAEKAYRSLLKKAKRDSKKTSQYYKSIGICQFMEGNKAGAQLSFRASIAANPSASISRNEVLDESVIKFFNESKNSKKGTASDNSSPQGMATDRTTSPGAPLSPAASPAKSTQLKILSNVTDGKVTIDGILAGDVGKSIEADAGKVEIVLSAAGYKSAQSTVTIKENTLNTFRIDLMKAPKKVEPTPKPKPIPVAVKNQVRPEKKTRKDKSKGAGAELFGDSEAPTPPTAMGRDVVREFDAEAKGAVQVPTYTPPPQAIMQPQMYPVQPVQQPQVTAQQPMYQQPMYQQPMYQQPMYQQPTYQQPVYQQPMYLPPMPPAYTPSENAPGESKNGFSESSSRRKKGKKQKSGKAEEVNVGISLLPLGIGQFYQDKILLGTFFAGAQIGGIYFWYSKTATSEASRIDSNAELAQREADRPTVAAEQGVYDAATNQYIDEQNAYIEGIDKQGTYGLAIAGAAYILSVSEALLNPPTGTPPREKPKKNRYPGFGGLNQDSEKDLALGSSEELTSPGSQRVSPIFRIDLVPQTHFSEGTRSASFLLNFDYRY